MPLDVQYSEIELPIGGQDEGVDKRILPPGKFVSVINGDFVKPGTIRKRPGIKRLVDSNNGDFVKGTRILRRKDQIAVFDAENTLAVHQYNKNSGNYVPLTAGGIAPIPTATVRQFEIENDLTVDVLADVAGTTNGYLVYGLVSCPAGSTTSQCRIRVVEAATGSVVLSEQVIPNIAAMRYVRAAASENTVIVTFSGGVAGSATIEAVFVDCTFGSSDKVELIAASTGPFVTFVLATDVDHSFGAGGWFGHDTVMLSPNLPTWVVAYRQHSSNQVRLMEVAYLGGVPITNSSNILSGGNPTLISVAVSIDGKDIITNWFNLDINGTGAMYYAVHDSITFGAVLVARAWDIVTTVRPLATAIGLTSATDEYILFASHTERHTPPNSKWTPITKTVQARRSGIATTTQAKRRYCITSKPWLVGDSQHAWAIVSDDGGEVAFEDTQDHHIYSHVLLSFQNDPLVTYPTSHGLDTVDWRPSIESSAPPGVAPNPNNVLQIFSVATSQLPQSVAIVNGGYYVCQLRAYVEGEARVGPISLQARYDHLGRYSNVEFAGDAYCTGGVVTKWDGTRLYEVGTIQAPELTARAETTGGTWGANAGPYQYTAVYEFVDSLGQRHHTLTAPPKQVTVGATDKVLIEIEPLTLTRFQRNNLVTRQFSRIYASIYRSILTPGGGSTSFQRLLQYDEMPASLINNPGATTPLTFTDTGFDNTKNEILYSETELENDVVYGGATTVCVHKDRLWFGGGIDPEVIWFSKPRVDERPAEFSVGQTFRIPGEEVVALGSLDEALIVFCTRGIYAVFGDGPDATGAGRAFDVPIVVNTDSACIGPRSVIQIPQGLIYQTRNGIFLLDHKRNITYIGEPIKDTIAIYPVVRGIVNDSSRGELLFALANAEGTLGTVAVYNYNQGLWSLWNHTKLDAANLPNIAPWADISPWINQEPLYLADYGNLYVQTAASGGYSDDTMFYGLDVETGWLSFGRMQGYKRIRKVGVLLERFDVHGLQVSMKYAYNETVASTINWSAGQITSIGAVEWLRITVPRQKIPSIRLRIKEFQTISVEPGVGADTKGFAIDGFAFQIGMIPGLMRLPAAQSG